MTLPIQTQNLAKTFNGGVVAVTGLELAVDRGTVYGLIGRNGAGKTTTLRLLMGLLRPNAGWARVLGCDLWEAPRSVRQKVAYVSQSQQLPGWMTFADICRYHASFYERWDADFAQRLARRWDVAGNRPLARLSGGEQRLAAVALALAARPEVILLDEPAAGLDPLARRSLLAGLVEALGLTDGCTVLLSTHLIADLQRVADAVGILDRGRLIAHARLTDLLDQLKRVQVVFSEPSPPRDFAVPGALRVKIDGPVATALVRFAGESQLDSIREMPGVRVNVFPMNLEEIFIELLGPTQLEEGRDDLAMRDFELLNLRNEDARV
jgi:ABC-2 type transport system ATP-binding protein